MSREKPSQRHIPAAHKIGQQPSSGDATLVTCPSNNPEHAPSPHPNMHHFPTGRIRALAPHRRVATRMWPSRKSWDKSRSWPTSWLRRALPSAPSNSTHPTSHTTGPQEAAPSHAIRKHQHKSHRPAWPCWDLETGLTPPCWPGRGWPSVHPTLGSRDEETPA